MKKYTGWMIVCSYIFYLLAVLLPSLLLVPAILAWLVPLLMWRSLGSVAVYQALALLLVGVLLIIFSASRGVFLGWQQIFAVNLPLLAMFVAIAFLTLTNKELEDPDLPKGKIAVVTTAVGTHLLGAVINLSVIFVFAERLKRSGALSKSQMIILARCFCACAWWSPFFIATGVALTYAPAMQWNQTLIPGAIMVIIGMGYSVIEVCFFRKVEFSGYPLKLESLVVPVFLAAAVIGVHHFWQDVSTLLLICVIAPVGALVFMKGRPRFATIRTFINTKLDTVSSQFALFLAAGLFSSGIKSITQVYPSLFSIDSPVFTPLLFVMVLGVMIVVGIIGVHPIVSIATVSPLLLPLNPDPSQLGFLFLSCWAISTGCGPLSGVGLALISRYKASASTILKINYHYAIAMWLIASLINMLFFSR